MNRLDGGRIEAIGVKQLEQLLGSGSLNIHLYRAIGLRMDTLLVQNVDISIIQLLDRLEVGDGLLDGVVGCGLDLAQEGHEQMADLIAAVIERGIGVVLDMLQMMLEGILLNLLTTKRQQRPYQMAVDRQDAMKTGKTGATEEVDEKGFGSVVTMVRGKDGPVAVLGQELLEIAVAENPGSLLNALMMLVGIVGSVELGHMDGNVILLRQLTDKLLVTITVAGAQMEIAMGDGKRIAGGKHEVRQHRGVDAATNSQQHLLPRREEVLLLNMEFETL